MKKKDLLHHVSMLKKADYQVKRETSVQRILGHQKHFLEWMTERYFFDHLELMRHLRSEDVLKLMNKEVPNNQTGYLRIFIKHGQKSYNIYSIKFIPYKIIHKFWGLGFQDVNIKNFTFYECLYENDHTKFRGCFTN